MKRTKEEMSLEDAMAAWEEENRKYNLRMAPKRLWMMHRIILNCRDMKYMKELPERAGLGCNISR